LSRPDLDIVIVNWNTGAQLRDALASVASALLHAFTLARVVIVDNASRDGSAAGLDELGLPVTIIKNDENRGFGAASNQGAASSSSKYLLFLNPDMRLYADSLSVAVAFLEEPVNAGIGLCGIQLVDAEGRIHRSCTRHPRPRHFVAKMTGLDRIAPRLFPSHVMTEWGHDEDRQVDHVMGAFLLVRREVFEQLGGFDERFFVYLEDLDFFASGETEGVPDDVPRPRAGVPQNRGRLRAGQGGTLVLQPSQSDSLRAQALQLPGRAGAFRRHSLLGARRSGTGGALARTRPRAG
jgi:GT2 family glycosyltransferase